MQIKCQKGILGNSFAYQNIAPAPFIARRQRSRPSQHRETKEQPIIAERQRNSKSEQREKGTENHSLELETKKLPIIAERQNEQPIKA